MGEAGTDTGGLRREFFRLLTRSLSETYLNATGGFQHNSVALQVHIVIFYVYFNPYCVKIIISAQNDVYRRLGVLMAASVVQGGSGLHLFNSSVYKYICTDNVTSIRPHLCQIPDAEVRELMDQVCMY